MPSIKNVFKISENKTVKSWGVEIDREWPEADMFARERRKKGELSHRDPPIPVMARVPAGTTLYHGTGAKNEWEIPHEMTWFAFHQKAAQGYETEVDEDDPFRVLTFVTVKELEVIYFPPIRTEEARNASYWLDFIFGHNFDMLGASRLPAAFKSIAQKYDGLYLDREDNGYPSVMISRPEQFVKIKK